jgi:hypothetical protein
MSAVILQSLRTKLLLSQTVGSLYALCNGQIWHIEAPQSTTMPLMVYAMTGEQTSSYFVSSSITQHIIEVGFAFYFRTDQGVLEALTAEKALFDLLHKSSITPYNLTTYGTIEILCISRGTAIMETDAIVINTTYRIIASKIS